ncbi:MAG: hypothetical protein ACNS60_16095 [Candidatus Cyclobacteriaceae bacterium M2_1C_046]
MLDQDQLKSNLQSLERKIKILLGEFKSLKDEVSFLKIENQELKSVIKTKEEQINHFQNQIKISKIVDNINSEDNGNSELKKKIDTYIKEIDKCIAHLSR